MEALNVIHFLNLAGTSKKAWLAAAMAVRQYIRFMAIRDKVQLVVQAEPDSRKLVLFGGTSIENIDGELVSSTHRAISRVNSLGRDLASDAMYAVERHFRVNFLAEMHQASELNQLQVKESLLTDLFNFVVLKRPVHLVSLALKDKRKRGLVVQRLLWTTGILQKDVFGLGIRVDGNSFSVATYNRCAQQRVELAKRSMETPNLMPLFKHDSSADALQRMRASFLTQGGTPAGWRWLAQQPWGVVRSVRTLFLDEGVHFTTSSIIQLTVGFINALAERKGGCVSSKLWDAAFPRCESTKDAAADALLIVAQAVAQRKLLIPEAVRLLTLARDYIEREKVASLKGATLQSLNRRQDEWHRRMFLERLERSSKGKTYTWSSLVPVVEGRSKLGALVATSLTSSQQLSEEGLAMRHCVGQYSGACNLNHSRIYSITVNGVREATLELRNLHGTSHNLNGTWKIGQIYGYSNSIVKNKDILAFANKVLSQYKKAAKDSLKEKQLAKENDERFMLAA